MNVCVCVCVCVCAALSLGTRERKSDFFIRLRHVKLVSLSSFSKDRLIMQVRWEKESERDIAV